MNLFDFFFNYEARICDDIYNIYIGAGFFFFFKKKYK